MAKLWNSGKIAKCRCQKQKQMQSPGLSKAHLTDLRVCHKNVCFMKYSHKNMCILKGIFHYFNIKGVRQYAIWTFPIFSNIYVRVHPKRSTSYPQRWKKSRAYIFHSNPPNIGAKMTVLTRAFKWYVIWPDLILLWWS